MCGFAGYVDVRGVDSARADALGHSMADVIAHRGPDDVGVWVDAKNGVVLGHRRLSIIDLSPAGHQPMMSHHKRYVIAFNGEIYNHLRLRKELQNSGKAPAWRGHSDTETILALIEAYGLEKALQKMVGMFAFALWDCAEKRLFLARDRGGEKPLYYGQQGDITYFASELKSIRVHPEFNAEINKDALCLFLRYNYIPQPYSIYNGLYKLPPGHYVELGKTSQPKAYWSLEDVVFQTKEQETRSDKEHLEYLDDILKEAVNLQMQADVPLGAFLSGGVDSSLIVALMQEQRSSPVKSFSIGFENSDFDEAPHARAVAKHIGTDHHELYVSSQQALDVVPKLPTLFDEPFADSSQIPTYLVSSMAREHVTVSLSGDAGDELFGGYNRYNWGEGIYRKLSFFPGPVKSLSQSTLRLISPEAWNMMLAPFMKLLPAKYRHKNIGERLHKVSTLFGASSEEELYRILVSHWSSPEKIVNGGNEPAAEVATSRQQVLHLPLKKRMMFYDTQTYLPDDILVKVDRAAMGVSLETRVPFLDHRVIEAAWALPMDLKIRNGVGKYCLRELLYRRVPRNLIERPKMGFGVPLGEWLRGPLKEWAAHLLDDSRLKQAGYLNAAEIKKSWEEHLSGRRNWQYHIWDILMFEAWRDEAGL